VIQQFVLCEARVRVHAAAGLGLLLLAGCSTALTQQTRYAGTLTGCGAPMPASLVRNGAAFAFAPGDGVLVIRGTVAPDGGVSGTLNTQPPGKPPFALSVRGRLDPAGAALTYATPRCQASGRLPAVAASILP
jgi:hypothetical protein